MEKVSYGGWPNCYRLSNGAVELVVTSDVGPRVIRFGFVGEVNVFAEYADQMGKTGGEEWRIYGGHRFWHAPEADPRSYYPDNGPVEMSGEGNTLRVVQPTESTTGMQKELTITLDATEPCVRVVHRLWNRNLWAVEAAPWALSVMAQGGKAILPQAPYAPHGEALLPARPLVLWSYTNMSDPRWYWGERYITLQQDPKSSKPQKVGVGVKEGWAAYANQGVLFAKRFRYHKGAMYPDFGCSVETFTNADMLELETLGPLMRIEPGSKLDHTEYWALFKGVTVGADEASIDAEVLPRVEDAERMMERWGDV